MKRLAFISGAVFCSLFVMGSLFKVMHWPGAGPLLTLGLAGTSLISIPFIAAYQYHKNKETDKS